MIGPTGDALAGNGTLYVADTLDNAILAVPNAKTRTTPVKKGLLVSDGKKINGPLGLTLAPNGDVLVANGGNGDIVEVTRAGKQVAQFLATGGGGSLFGLELTPGKHGIYFVNDSDNTLRLAH